jgi:hypothetical protein
VINKYYPPDFDPSKIVKKKKKIKTGSAAFPTVRFMTPYSIRCVNCGEYTSKSRKFNARKETTTETYLGMKTIKLHIKCPSCASEIVFRTDPKSADYVIMYGAKKLYDSGNTNEVLKEETLEETLSRLEREEQEARQKELEKEKKSTTLEELEAKLNDIRRKQDMNDELDEIQQRNAKLEVFASNTKQKKKEEEEERQRLRDQEDEKLAQMAFAKTTTTILNQHEFNEPEPEEDLSSDSDYDQPLLLSKHKQVPKVMVKRKANNLGISVKKKVKN